MTVRVLRPLSAIGFINEVGEKTWEANLVTKAMATEQIASGHRMVYVLPVHHLYPANCPKLGTKFSIYRGEMIVGAANKAPNYLREGGYRCPTEPRDGFMQYAFQTKMTTFELFSSIPKIFKDFNTFMGSTMGARGYWVDWYPVQKRLLDGADTKSALIVDVGGGKGHDLVAFQAKFPGQGPLVLQDLAPVIQSLTHLNPAIEAMAYDFFTEQPVKGLSSLYSVYEVGKFAMEIGLIHSSTYRGSIVLLPSYLARLVRYVLCDDSGAAEVRHETWLLQAPPS